MESLTFPHRPAARPLPNRPILLLAALGCLLSASPAPAADLAVKGREVFKRYQTTVVTVQLVIKNKFSMRGMANDAKESKQEVTGTVIDPSGLTVLSLTSTDPGGLVQSMLSGMDGGDDNDFKFKMETELSDVKLLCADGTELPAEVVLRDRDLDLAFVRPKSKPEAPLPALDLANNAPVQMLDEVVAINRLGKVAGRAYAASFERIHAIVSKPRLFYVPGSDATATGLGCPAFTPEGKLVGIFVMRAIKSGGGGMGMFDFTARNLAAILLPADTILKIAKQVPPQKDQPK